MTGESLLQIIVLINIAEEIILINYSCPTSESRPTTKEKEKFSPTVSGTLVERALHFSSAMLQVMS